MVGRGRVIYLDLFQDAALRIHSRLPELRRIHFTQAFVSLYLNAFHACSIRFRPVIAFRFSLFVFRFFDFRDCGFFLRIGVYITRYFACLNSIERRSSDIEIPALYDHGEIAVEKRQDERPDVCAVHVRIGHDDDAMIPQAVCVEFVSDGGPQRDNERFDLF